MLKRILLGIFGTLLVIIVILFALYPQPKLQAEATNEDYCSKYGVVFDALSIEAIYSNPGDVLHAGEQFRSSDPAYLLFSLDRKRLDKPFPMERWERTLERLASWSMDKRKQQLPYRIYQGFEAQKQTFCKNVIPFIQSYLPDETDVSATVYFTALENAAAGISAFSDIAYSLSHRLVATAARIHQGSGTTTVFNLLGHELVHIGYSAYNHLSEISEEEWRKNEIVIDILHPTQNEGLATYVSYQLTDKYPIPLEWDLYLIKNKLVVKWYIKRLNNLLALAGTPAGTEAYNDAYHRIGDFGYNKKGFYIVGAHMAKTIEEQLGRDALVKTVVDGFYAFAEKYNSVVEDDMKIHYNIR